LIQLIPDAISLDAVKKQSTWPGSLRAYFQQVYGAPGTPSFDAALENYVQSMAGYSIVTYLLAIKDR
jgi:phosphatidylinositol 4-kinase